MKDSSKNALAYYLNFVVMALLGLAVNPLLVGAMGAQSFGVWKAIQRFLDFATVADGRATQSLKWVVSYRHGTQSDADKQRDVGATLVVWVLWLPVLLIVTGTLVLIVPHAVRGFDDNNVVLLSASILALNTVMMGILWIPDSVLVGTNQAYRSTIITTVVVIIANASMVVVAVRGGGPIGLAAVTLVSSIVNGVVTYATVRRSVGWWGVRRPRRDDVRRVSGFSGLTLAWSATERVFLSGELILIGVFIGAHIVANYTFTSYVLQLGISLCLVTTSALMPTFGRAVGSRDLSPAVSAAVMARERTLAVATFLCSGTLLLNGSFVTLWAGEVRYMGNVVNALMTLAVFQFVLARCESQMIDATLRPGTKVALGASSGLLSIAAAAGAYVVTNSLPMMYLALIIFRMPMTVGFPVIMRRRVAGAALPADKYVWALILMLLAFAAGSALPHSSWLSLLVAAGLGIPLIAGGVFWGVLLPSTQNSLRSFWRFRIGRLRWVRHR